MHTYTIDNYKGESLTGFGLRIKDAIDEVGLKQSVLCKVAERSSGWISNLLNGRLISTSRDSYECLEKIDAYVCAELGRGPVKLSTGLKNTGSDNANTPEIETTKKQFYTEVYKGRSIPEWSAYINSKVAEYDIDVEGLVSFCGSSAGFLRELLDGNTKKIRVTSEQYLDKIERCIQAREVDHERAMALESMLPVVDQMILNAVDEKLFKGTAQELFDLDAKIKDIADYAASEASKETLEHAASEALKQAVEYAASESSKAAAEYATNEALKATSVSPAIVYSVGGLLLGNIIAICALFVL